MGRTTRITSLAILLLAVLVAGCNESFEHFDEESTTHSYTFTVTMENLTANQPMSPVAVVIHKENYSPWPLGGAASAGLEVLAEDGEPGDFLDEAKESSEVLATAQGSVTFDPGQSQTVYLNVSTDSDIAISVASQLGNTNDGFAGLGSYDISYMTSGQTVTILVTALDAGTEANTETAATIPGPAAYGQGYNAARNDVNFVSVHRGVVTKADGLTSSVLDQSHRFLNPVAKLTIKKTKKS